MLKTTQDCIIRIKNGYLAEKQVVDVPYSKINEMILEILKKHNYISNFSSGSEKIKKYIQVNLLYRDEIPALRGIKLFSKPGRKVYCTASKLRAPLGGLGLSIITTPKGILTNHEAKKNNVGGELLFDIW